MYNHNKAQQSKNRVHISWDIVYLCSFSHVLVLWLCMFLAMTKQLYEWLNPPVHLSVHHTFFTMFPSSYYHDIFRSYYQWQKWCPCKRSRSEVKTQFCRFRTITPVWIHIWWLNYAQSLMLLRRRSPAKFQGHTANKNRRFWPKLGVSGL